MKYLRPLIILSSLASAILLSGCDITINKDDSVHTGDQASFVSEIKTDQEASQTSTDTTQSSDQTSSSTETAQPVSVVTGTTDTSGSTSGTSTDTTSGTTSGTTTGSTSGTTSGTTTGDTSGTTSGTTTGGTSGTTSGTTTGDTSGTTSGTTTGGTSGSTSGTTTGSTGTTTVVNTSPVANADGVLSKEDQIAIISGVLSNDSDADGDTLVITSFTQGQYGAVSQTSADQFSYNPQPNFNGVDSFEYVISDGQGGTATAKVTVSIAPVDDLPAAQADSFTLNQNSMELLNLISNDSGLGDGVQVFIASAPSNGNVVVNADGTVSYTPAIDYYGTDSFVYRLEDSDGDIAIASVSLNIACVSTCGSHTFSLSWEASLSPHIATYKVYVGTNSGVYTDVIDVGDVRSYNHLVNNKGTYYFAITAVTDDLMESPYSNEKMLTF